ncbi:MAG: phage holin family protein [Bacteroidales bacterium]|nr:phage holin family protein [Bacteroidales bacterium]
MKIVIGDSNHHGFWGFVAQTIVLTLAVIIAAKLMPGVSMNNVWTALLTGLVIALLNRFLRPVLIFLTLPFTAITLGLFLFVINAVIILLAGAIVPGFTVEGFGTALLFSLLLTLLNFFLDLPNRIKKQPDDQSLNHPSDDNDQYTPYEEVE